MEEASYREGSPMFSKSQRSQEQGRMKVSERGGHVKNMGMHYGASVTSSIASISNIINSRDYGDPTNGQPNHLRSSGQDSLAQLQTTSIRLQDERRGRASEVSQPQEDSLFGSFFSTVRSLIMPQADR